MDQDKIIKLTSHLSSITGKYFKIYFLNCENYGYNWCFSKKGFVVFYVCVEI